MPEPVQQISSDGLNSQHALLVRESDLAEMMNLGGDERIYPASMTKIMTALLTIENLPDLNETITVPEDIFEELTAQDASVAGLIRTNSRRFVIFSMVCCCHPAQMHVRHWREQSADRKKVLWP